MRHLSSAQACFLATLGCAGCLLAACSAKPSVPASPSSEARTSSSAPSHALSWQKISNASYTLLTPAVRYKLTAADLNFSVHMKNGSFEFPHPSAVAPYGTVRLFPEFLQYGELTGDDREDAAVILEVGTGDDAKKEVAVLSESGGTALHMASYLLGHADVLSFRIENHEIHVKVKHVLPGDPGPRKTEFVFVVKKS